MLVQRALHMDSGTGRGGLFILAGSSSIWTLALRRRSRFVHHGHLPRRRRRWQEVARAGEVGCGVMIKNKFFSGACRHISIRA